jgi:hypothetical protein
MTRTAFGLSTSLMVKAVGANRIGPNGLSLNPTDEQPRVFVHSHCVNRPTDPSQPYAFAEDIRLVVRDLDETFWRGTLTEGGVEVVPEHVEIVRALARRGVMSSICSKNDLAPVRDILVAHDIWRYFVFPDVSWAPKGPRVQALIEQAQLRPASVLFIDDNPTNLAEAARFVPAVNLADEGVIPRLLTHPQLTGKPIRTSPGCKATSRWRCVRWPKRPPALILRTSFAPARSP